MSDSVRPHRRQPTRLPRPWDSPGKNTVVGCHFLLQCMKVKSESEVAQLCRTISNPMDCSLPGSSVHGIFQSRVLEWGAIAFSISYWFMYFKTCKWIRSLYSLNVLMSNIMKCPSLSLITVLVLIFTFSDINIAILAFKNSLYALSFAD